MLLDHQNQNPNPNPTKINSITNIRVMTGRRIFLRRWRKPPTIRLGGKKPRRGLFIRRMLRRMRLRWLKLQNSCMIRKLKEYYENLVKHSATKESTFQQRIYVEPFFALPVMQVVSFSIFPSVA
ncbi:hypothetical protein CFOL_v3_04966 [Cephalotus follicularis]|uniref:Uncharacterized protein n=1 Tax=Cephalotus follicularis TaxID=3775 RepID=A0A1Q3B0D5_CEPFO|nr:hypothetical protein CFOL_v3_04966 [Cephalotus follicularis]